MTDLTNIDNIRDILSRHGFRFSKSLGQNFLAADWVPERIAEEAGLAEDVGVLEVGPGVGCLTAELSKRAGKVLSVEMDKRLMPVLAETLAGCENVEVLFGDVLKQDIPALMDESFPGLRRAACANLPYSVTSPVLTELINARCFESITVMVQREVARRICAAPDTEDYGAFSVFCQWKCETEILFDVGPECFIPRPKVTSSVIRLIPREKPPVQTDDEELFFRVVRSAFNQRRKTLVNALSSGFAEIPKTELEKSVISCGFPPNIRGEVLGINDFAQIADYIGALNQR